MKNNLLLFATAALVLGILAGCGTAPTATATMTGNEVPTMDSATAEMTMPAAPTEASVAATNTAAPAGPLAPSDDDFKVEIEDFAFGPGTLTVKVGTTVTWTNKDDIGHTATSDNGVFDSGMLQKGQSYSFTFSQAGTYGYFCKPHPYMVGTIVVVE